MYKTAEITPTLIHANIKPDVFTVQDQDIMFLAWVDIPDEYLCKNCHQKCSGCPIFSIVSQGIESLKNQLEKNTEGAILSAKIDWSNNPDDPSTTKKSLICNPVYAVMEKSINFFLIPLLYEQDLARLLKLINSYERTM